MKLFYILLITLFSMNSNFAQSPKVPETPSVKTNNKNGLIFSEAKTKTSYAFACTFEKVKKKTINDCIRLEYDDFNKRYLFNSKDYKVFIELKDKELKLEFMSKNESITNDYIKLEKIANCIKAIFSN